MVGRALPLASPGCSGGCRSPRPTPLGRPLLCRAGCQLHLRVLLSTRTWQCPPGRCCSGGWEVRHYLGPQDDLMVGVIKIKDLIGSSLDTKNDHVKNCQNKLIYKCHLELDYAHLSLYISFFKLNNNLPLSLRGTCSQKYEVPVDSFLWSRIKRDREYPECVYPGNPSTFVCSLHAA